MPCCTRSEKSGCSYRGDLWLFEPSRRLPGLDFIAAHYRMNVLSDVRLYNLLPAIVVWELPILYTWAVEYTARKIPWVVDIRGAEYVMSLWKARKT